MRLFIAAPLPPSLLDAIILQQEHYKQPGVRLVPAANLHLTVHFLGETAAETLPVLKDKLTQIGQTHPAFDLKFKETAPGPKLASPRLIWSRFHEHPGFATLAQAVSSAFPANGKSHPDFIPHITIARLKKEILTGAALPIIKEADFPIYPVNEIALWQSELGSPHPRYTVLQTFNLVGGA